MTTGTDLENARDAIIHDGARWFFHFLEHLTGVREIVLAAVTEAIRKDGFSYESEVVKLVRAKAPEIPPKQVIQTLEGLGKEGLITIESENKKGPPRITIQIDLFKRYLSKTMGIDKSLAAWRSSSRRRKTQTTSKNK